MIKHAKDGTFTNLEKIADAIEEEYGTPKSQLDDSERTRVNDLKAVRNSLYNLNITNSSHYL